MVCRTLGWVLASILLLGSVGVQSGCDEKTREKMEQQRKERQRKKATKNVGERAHEYMIAMRWHDFQAASEFYEKADDRVAFLKSSTSPGASYPVVESFTIDYILLDEENTKAEVRVTLNEIDAATQMLGTRGETLLWYQAVELPEKPWCLVPVVVVQPEN